MKTRDLTELAFRNLREAILRNSLTTLGVAVGVASLVAMLSLGVGLQTLASEKLNKSGLFDAVYVTPRRGMRGPGGGDGDRPRRNEDKTTKSEPAKSLDETARLDFEKLPNVTEAYPQVRFLTEVRYNGASYSTNVLGMPESSRNTGSFDAITGKYFSSPSADEAILQVEFAKQLDPQPSSLVGKEITLRYAQRQETPPPDANKPKDIDDEMDDLLSGGGISIASHDKKVRIVGIIDTDPSVGIGGFGGGR